jgi:RNA polymerase sigma-70 factor, ECF subfamily
MITDTRALSIGRASTTAATKGVTDEQLIARIADGNRLAMRVLFARFNERVYRFALRLTADEGLADDVVSEVFFEVWRKAATFEGRSQVSTWILGIARNKALDARKARSTDGWDEAAAHAVADPTADPEAAYLKKDLRAVMRKCLAQLSPTHREIVDLVYYHGKSIDEIARLTGAAQATVKTRMFYARKHLAELLGAYGISTAAA